MLPHKGLTKVRAAVDLRVPSFPLLSEVELTTYVPQRGLGEDSSGQASSKEGDPLQKTEEPDGSSEVDR